jgi:hypothetical protein
VLSAVLFDEPINAIVVVLVVWLTVLEVRAELKLRKENRR